MTPYEQSIQEAKNFVKEQLGHTPQVKELMFYISKLETGLEDLRRHNSDMSWQLNPDRMGS